MNKINLQRARDLRKRSTDAERLLWKHLRTKRMNNLKFKRQQPIGNYIVDFICFEKRIVIELDGGQHALQRDKDKGRDSWLEGQGFLILRFWNNDVLTNIHGVMEVIIRTCSEAHSL